MRVGPERSRIAVAALSAIATLLVVMAVWIGSRWTAERDRAACWEGAAELDLALDCDD